MLQKYWINWLFHITFTGCLHLTHLTRFITSLRVQNKSLKRSDVVFCVLHFGDMTSQRDEMN